MTRSGSPNHRSAFTLIELLIVVAIIGILAAIAVPNFQNARLKAKVAQAKGDIRALAMAHEQYFLDLNTYPNESEDHPYERARSEAGLFWLTSPIAYMSSLPLDPFRPKFDESRTPRMYETGVASRGKRHVGYMIFTVGPDGDENGLWSAQPFFGIQRNNGQGNTYAPSNGLTSLGDIYWYGGDPSVMTNVMIDGRFYNGSFPSNFAS